MTVQVRLRVPPFYNFLIIKVNKLHHKTFTFIFIEIINFLSLFLLYINFAQVKNVEVKQSIGLDRLKILFQNINTNPENIKVIPSDLIWLLANKSNNEDLTSRFIDPEINYSNEEQGSENISNKDLEIWKRIFINKIRKKL